MRKGGGRGGFNQLVFSSPLSTLVTQKTTGKGITKCIQGIHCMSKHVNVKFYNAFSLIDYCCCELKKGINMLYWSLSTTFFGLPPAKVLITKPSFLVSLFPVSSVKTEKMVTFKN